MADSDRKDLNSIIATAVGAAATLIGLITDVSQIRENLLGRVFLFFLFLILVGYIVHHLYTKFWQAYEKAQRKLEDIKGMVVNFTSKHANKRLDGILDLELINLIIDTRQRKTMSLAAQEIQHLPNNQVKVVIDKGHSDGLEDRMRFKVLHSSRLDELGTCTSCTAAHDRATLVFTLEQNCPIAIQDIVKDSVRIELIDPEDSSEFNTLFANLLFELDSHKFQQ